MCRLLGLIANKPVDLRFSLTEGPKTLADMSKQNPDGWGLGWYQDGQPKIEKEPRQAGDSEQFLRTSAEGSSHIFVAHVRTATIGSLTKHNCHPFRSGKWLFAHNGTIYEHESLRQHLSHSHQKAIQGETDSEVFFHWLLQNIESSDSVIEGLKSAIQAIPDYTALNFLLSDGDVLYAYRDANVSESYYTLYWVVRSPEQEGGFVAGSKEVKALFESKKLRGERAVLVCSERLTEEPWEEIPIGSLLVVDKNLIPRWLEVK
jgi:glutamine amidotransferase